jgi:hypothetical protein
MAESICFGIDFDGTFNRAPRLFDRIIRTLYDEGHTAVIVTGRSDEGQWGAEVREAIGDLIPVVFAARRWKRQAAREAGFHVDIWIDDVPEYVDEQTLINVREQVTR